MQKSQTSQSTILAPTSLLITALIILCSGSGLVQAQLQCAKLLATQYTGHLDDFIYYGDFNQAQNGYFKFLNPYSSISNLTSFSIHFWARLPNQQTLTTKGTLLDCNNSIQIRLDQNGLLHVNVTQVSITTKKKVTTTSLVSTVYNLTLFPGQQAIFEEWNHYAFTYSNQSLKVFVNYVLQGSINLAIAQVNSNINSTYCVLGNSGNLTDPSSVNMRHVVMMNQSISNATTLRLAAKSMLLPNSSNVMAYYRFGQDFRFEDTYFMNVSRGFSSQGVTIEYASESERICYCSTPNPGFLQVQSSFQLSPLNFTSANSSVDSNGVQFSFQIYPQQISSTNNQTLLSVMNYADIVLSQNGSSLMVNIYDQSKIVQAQVLFSTLFRYAFWTNYTILLTSKSATLLMDGAQVEQKTISVTLPTVTNPQIMIGSPSLTYLLANIQLRPLTVQSAIINFNFTQDKMLPLYQTNYTQSGTLVFQNNNQLCSQNQLYSPQNFIQANSELCLSSINSININTSLPQNQLSSYLASAQQTMTIELWIKDASNYPFSNKTASVIFENSYDNKTSATQIALLNGNVVNTDTYKQVKVTPNVSQATKFAFLPVGQTNGIWVHLSVSIWNGNIEITTYNTSSQQVSTNAQAISSPFTQNLVKTIIGSSFNGSSKFYGSMREFRIWNVIRSGSDLSTYRFSQNVDMFQSTDVSTYNPSLLYYFRMDSGDSFNSLYDVISGGSLFVSDKSTNSSSYSWQQDNSLVLCANNYYYDGTCCLPLSIGSVQFNFQYSPSGTVLMVALNETASNPLYSGVLANFSISAIGNPNLDQNYSNTFLYPTFNQVQSRGFNVSSTQLKSAIYSITIQAIIYSPYASRTVTLTKTVMINCPNYYITLNGQNVSEDDSYFVTNQANYFLQIKYNFVDNVCYNATSGSLVTANLTKASWSMSATSPTFTQLWSTSTDGTTITQNLNLTTTLTRNVITLTITTSTGNTFTTFLILNYFPIQLINPITSGLSFIRNQIEYQPLALDFSTVQVQATGSAAATQPLFFNVTCPSQIFANSSQYNQLCQVNPSSYQFSLVLDPTQLNLTYSYLYQFSFLIGIQNTSIMKVITANVTLYKDGSSQLVCPTLIYNSSYLYNKVNQTSYNITPIPYLYCSSGVFYELASSSWTVFNQNTQKTVTNALNFSSTSPLSVFLRSDNNNLFQFIGGTNLLLSSNTTYRYVNATGYLNSSTAKLNNSFTVVYQSNPLIQQVVFQSYNKTTLNSSQISFLEPNFTINATGSIDPDNSSAVLNYIWTCPSMIPSVNCTQMLGGSRNSTLTFTIWHRFKFGFKHGVSYQFNLTIYTPDNTFKPSVTNSYTVIFNPPNINDVNIYMLPTNCEQLNVPYDSQVFQNGSLTKFLDFNKLNYSSAQFSILPSTDNGVVGTSSCGYGSVTDQIILFYAGGLDSSIDPFTVNSVFSPNSVPASNQFTENLGSYSNIQTLPEFNLIPTIVFMFTKRTLTNHTFANIQVVYVQKARAPLVPQFKSSSVSVEKYSYLILDASPSYDSETGTQPAFTYSWSCPNNLPLCSSLTGPILNVSYPDRVASNINSVNGQTYTYSVSISDNSGNVSPNPATATVTFYQLPDYSSCGSLTFLSSADTTNLFQSNNQTIVLSYQQSQSLFVTFQPLALCAYANLGTSQWFQPNQTISQFWNQSSESNTLWLNGSVIKNFSSGQLTALSYTLPLTMGYDTQVYSYNTFVNFFIQPPEIIPIIQGQSIFVDGEDDFITFDASSSIDPINQTFTCSWDCPSYFGGNNCQNTCLFSMSFSNLKDIIAPQDLSYYAQQSYPFYLRITSSDGIRTTNLTYQVFISDGSEDIFNETGFNECKIQNQNYQPQSEWRLQLNQTLVFSFDCGYNTYINDMMVDEYNYTWSVDGLTNGTDYYILNNVLYIMPYALTKISGNEVIVRYVTNSTSLNGDRRLSIATSSLNQISQSFQFMLDTLSQGNVSVTYNSNQAYTADYWLSFTGFQYLIEQPIYLQLRGFQTIYQAQQVITPLKRFSPDRITTYFSNFSIPIVSSLYLDFYTVNLDYVGSYDLSQSLNISNLSLGYMTFNNYEKMLLVICQKTYLNYPQNDTGILLFENDIYNLQLLTEMMTNGLVLQLSSIMANNYAQSILSYLNLNFGTVLTYFDPNYSFERAKSRYNIEKQVLLIFYNLINLGSGIQQRVLSMLNVLQLCTQDYSQLMASVADPNYIRSVVLSIQSTLNIQLANTNLTNKNYYFSQSQAIYNQVQTYDLNQASASNQSVVVTNTNTMSSYILKISNTSTAEIDVTNNLNLAETVEFPSQALLGQLGVTNLNVQFTLDTNTTSAVQTALTINAYDVNNNYVAVSLDQSQGNAFNMQFQVKQSALAQVTGTSPNYTLACSYFNQTTAQWQTPGVVTTQFDNVSGMISCSSYHLTQFSVIMVQPPPVQNNTNNGSTGGNGTSFPNGTGNGNGTGQNQSTGQNNSTSSLFQNNSGPYYIQQSGNYAAAIIVPTLAVIASLIFACLTTQKDSSPTRIRKNQKQPYCHVFWAAAKIYHPLVSSLVNQKAQELAIPKLYQMISFWIFIYSVALVTLIDFKYVANESGYVAGRGVIIALIYLAGLILLRPFFNWLKYALYHKDTIIDYQRRKNQGRKVIYQNSLTENQELQHRESESRRKFKEQQNNSGEGPLNYEGGSENEESDFVEDKNSDDESSHFEQRHVEDHKENLSGDTNEQLEGKKGLKGSKLKQEDLVSSMGRQSGYNTMANVQGSMGIGPKKADFDNVVSPDQNYNTGHKFGQSQFRNSAMQNVMVSPQIHFDQNDLEIQIADDDEGSGSPGLSSSSPPRATVTAAISNQADTQLYQLNQRQPTGNSSKKVRYQDDTESKHNPSTFIQGDQVPFERDPRPLPRDDFDSIAQPRRSVQKQNDQAANVDIQDVKIEVQSLHNFKGVRMCLLLIWLTLLTIVMVATFAVMSQISLYDGVITWLLTTLGIVLIFLFILESIFLAIFVGIFRGQDIKSDKTGCLTFSSFLLVGSPHISARQSLWLELNH